MPKTITATTAAKKLREVLNAVEQRGETFRVERHGHPVAEIGPTRAAKGTHARWEDVRVALENGPKPDRGLAADLAAIRASAGLPPPDPWAPSSTHPS